MKKKSLLILLATDFVQTSTGRSGANHARYIAAEGRYSDKAEVVFYKDLNLHRLTPTAVDFFKAADQHEAQARSGKGRSYRDLMIALPHELETKEAAIAYSEAYAAEVCGADHAARLGVHLKDGNWHLHLIFSERKTRNDLPLADNFARGKNNKVRNFVSDEWLNQVKNRNLQKILKLCPGYKPAARGEEKIGPKLKYVGAPYEAARSARESRVHQLRDNEKLLLSVNNQIEGLKLEQQKQPVAEKKRSSALDRILARPVKNHRSASAQEIRLARSQKATSVTALSALDRIAERTQQKIQEKIRETETESIKNAMAGHSASKSSMEAWTVEQNRKLKTKIK